MKGRLARAGFCYPITLQRRIQWSGFRSPVESTGLPKPQLLATLISMGLRRG